MKKLMIALGAAAMISLGAQAKPADGVSLATGTGFNNYSSAWAPDKDDAGEKNGKVYWTGGGGDSSIKVKTEGGSDQYLYVDETEELTRLIDVNGGVASNATVTADSGIYFSSKVQFTAMDGEPAVSNGVDKIIVWAKAPEDGAPEGTTTNLMVTALDLVNGVTHFDTGTNITADVWYTLDIIAEAQDNEDSPIKFTVMLDGNVIGTYNSMVSSATTGADTISSASFKGTGAVDDIDWGTVAVEELPDVTVTVVKDASVEVFLDAEGKTPLPNDGVLAPVKAGQPVTVYVYAEATDTVQTSAGSVGDYTGELWPVTYVTTADNLSVTMTITVEADDGKTAITASDVTLSYTNATYYVGINYPTVTVTVNNVELTVGTDYTVSWVPDTITAAGGDFTVTVTGIGENYKGEVVKTITITPAGGDKAKVGDTEYANGADFVAAATSGTVNTLPSGWTVDGNVVKDGTGAPFATFPAFYNVTLTGTTLTLELNNNALATMTAVTVGETFGLSVSASDTKLYYGLSSSTTVTGDYTAPTALVPGTGNALTIPAAKSGSGNQCFYKLYVTDIAPAQN